MSLLQEIKQNIQARFGDGQFFTVLDFPELDKKYDRKRVRSSLSTLCGKGNYLNVIGKVKSGIGNMPPVNRYAIKNKIAIHDYEEIPTGTITIWQSKKPINECKDGEVYRVKFWDNSESHRAWRNGMWWNQNGNSLAAAFVKQWRGVTR